MRELPGFWVACRNSEELSDPLAIGVPGLGEALAVFCFEEEARLYLGHGDDGPRPCPVGAGELVALLLGPWSRFDLITLDPMPGNDAGLMLRLASIRREDFLDYLANKHVLGWPAHDGEPQVHRQGTTSLGYARPVTGLVGGPPAQE